MDILRARVNIPVLGTRPAIREAQAARRDGEILAMATHATLNSPTFRQEMRECGDHVIPIAGDGLVELVESGRADTPGSRTALENLLKPYLSRQIDGIVLGCTHYPFLLKQFRALFPNASFLKAALKRAANSCVCWTSAVCARIQRPERRNTPPQAAIHRFY